MGCSRASSSTSAGDRIALIHTEVLPAFEGRGVAAGHRPVRPRRCPARGRKVVATCPYVQGYLARHPEELDIVVG